jgi:hypothetical protein
MRLLLLFCAGLLMAGCGLSFNPDLPSGSEDGGLTIGDGGPPETPVGDGDGLSIDGDGDDDGAMGGLGGQGGTGPEETR